MQHILEAYTLSICFESVKVAHPPPRQVRLIKNMFYWYPRLKLKM